MKILGYNYTIVADRQDGEIGGYSGSFSSTQQRIQVASNICNEQKISTILHEILEALNYHLQFKLEHNIIASLESGLYQVLTENGVDLTPLAKELK